MGEVIIDLTNELDDTDLDTNNSLDGSQETIVLDDTLNASDQIAETERSETPTSTLSHDQSEAPFQRKPMDFGDCTLCWEQLGIDILASTKCGHVFCLKCLQRALQIEPLCPICSCPIVGNSDYHPLFLRIR